MLTMTVLDRRSAGQAECSGQHKTAPPKLSTANAVATVLVDLTTVDN